MPAPSQPAAIAPESATTALYRAALGPVNLDRYLRVFAGFDEAGRAGPGWNWAAALLTLNWLVFRQLWGVALVYVAAVEGLALLVLGLGRDGLARPSPLEWGLLGAIVLLGCLIPGLYGNAWLHADARRRMTRAVREARTVREACDTLARRASTRRRLAGLAVINVLLVAAALGAYSGLSRWMADQQVSPEVTAPRDAVPEPVTPAVADPVPLPVAVPDPVPSAPVAEPAPAEPPPPEPVSAPAPVPPAEVSSGSPQGAEAALPAPTRAAALAGFSINVGLFADATNADRVHTRLLDAGLPAYIQVVDFPNGQRTRVRVGPFASRALADEAALRIRALGFEAQVYRQ
ncbi:MAG: SPOR domain-containing protein [Hydrogenophaga sp.]|uniref:SPOR domain-containing protein n=1 Tax=Hydrogenophaga sp. TaxID=1904254 RepID=UPI00261402E2|nr:SPOR domain-containing protein [Hydrogenophaga sp.]MDM7942805.1 SPOR domain-containing protein [Hydrogenophaga sp.]